MFRSSNAAQRSNRLLYPHVFLFFTILFLGASERSIHCEDNPENPLPEIIYLDDKIEQVIERLQHGDERDLILEQYKKPDIFVAQLMNKYKTFNGEIRLDVAYFVFDFEQHLKDEAQSKKAIWNPQEKITAFLVDILINEKSVAIREDVAINLYRYDPKYFDKYKGKLFEAIHQWNKDIATLFILSGLPSSDDAAIIELAQKYRRSENESDNLMLDSILARHGDKAAEERLINFL